MIRWWYERGRHGYSELNEAGQELLSFLSTHEVTICNNWFKIFTNKLGSIPCAINGIVLIM